MITINNLSKVYETKKVLSIENLDFQKVKPLAWLAITVREKLHYSV